MGSLFLGLLLSNIVAFVVVVASMPFHFKTSNVITISMGFWLSLYSLIHIVNCEFVADDPGRPLTSKASFGATTPTSALLYGVTLLHPSRSAFTMVRRASGHF